MKKRVRAIVVSAYLVTWIGGWYSHVCEMSGVARRLYTRAEANNAQLIEWERQGHEKTRPIELLPGGPKSVVNWCVPILPGVLLADSHYVVGPVFAKGSTKIVFYYGVGSSTFLELWGWIS